MTVLLYGIVPAGTALAGAGLGGRPLRTIRSGPLQAIVSNHLTPPRSDGDMLWAFEAVLERLMSTMPIVPARFGTVAQDDEEIHRVLGERRTEWLATIDRIRGAVELAVHLDDTEAAALPRSGTDYLRSRLQERDRMASVDAATAGLFRERAEVGGRSTGYLVEAGDVERFIRAADEAGAVVTGPWPPFSFVR